MDFADVAALAEDPAFVSRIRAALVTEARVVLAESTSTEGHALRVRFARSVIRLSSSVAREMAYVVAATDGISEASQDSALTAAIRDAWNDYAGV